MVIVMGPDGPVAVDYEEYRRARREERLRRCWCGELDCTDWRCHPEYDGSDED
jgi:hypothetical protein